MTPDPNTIPHSITLAFDTSSSQGGVAVLRGSQVLSRQVWIRDVSHGELLTPALQQAVSDAGLKLADIDRIAIGHGPGSFTGVRVAVNAARALGYALNKPIAAYATDEILAIGAPGTADVPLMVLINAQKNLVFASSFANVDCRWVQTRPLALMPIDDVENIVTLKHLCLGDGFDAFQALMSPGLRARLQRDPQVSDLPLPENLGHLDQIEQHRRPALVWKDISALYLRASGAEEKLGDSHGRKA